MHGELPGWELRALSGWALPPWDHYPREGVPLLFPGSKVTIFIMMFLKDLAIRTLAKVSKISIFRKLR